MTTSSTQKTCSNYPVRLFTGLFLGLTLVVALSGCGGDDSGTGIGDGGSASPVGAVVSLAWDPIEDPSVYAYFVRYGKQSAGSSGSCGYPYATYVGSSSATIAGLDYDTQYYFAVSAYNGAESSCSNEVSTVTPSPT
jgi:hypothetical protein